MSFSFSFDLSRLEKGRSQIVREYLVYMSSDKSGKENGGVVVTVTIQ